MTKTGLLGPPKKEAFWGLARIRILSTKFYDDETGLVYYGYRYYSPNLGRWISRDPIEEYGHMSLRKVPTADRIRLTSETNLFIYLKNNPVNATDSLGLYAIDKAGNPIGPGGPPRGLIAASHTMDCSYYDDAYKQTGCQYYKDAKNWCERFKLMGKMNNALQGWTTCVRSCLQLKDRQGCRPSPNMCPDCDAIKRCNGDNHQYCYTACRYVNQESNDPNVVPPPPPDDRNLWDKSVDWIFNGPIGDVVNWAAFY